MEELCKCGHLQWVHFKELPCCSCQSFTPAQPQPEVPKSEEKKVAPKICWSCENHLHNCKEGYDKLGRSNCGCYICHSATLLSPENYTPCSSTASDEWEREEWNGWK